MWKYELEFRTDKPDTKGEVDKHFDLDNYKDWLEGQLTECRKKLSTSIVNDCDEYMRGYRDAWRDCCKDVKEFG